MNDPVSFDLSSDFDIAHTFFIRFINVADLTLVMRDIEQNLLDGDVDVPYQTIQYFMLSDLIVKSFDINVTETVATSPTFTRNSQATNDDGTTVSTNVPRFGSNGLTIEEGTVNVLKSYLNMQNWYKGTAVSGISPTVDTYLGNTVYVFNLLSGTNLYSYVRLEYYSLSITDPTGKAYTFSIYAKKNTYRYIGLRVFTPTPAPTLSHAIFDFDTGTVLNQQSYYSLNAIYVGDGWYKLSLTNNSCGSSPYVGICLPGSNGWEYANYAGTESVYLMFENQIEQKKYPTSFIANTRVGELLTIPANAIPAQGRVDVDYAPYNLTSDLVRCIFDWRQTKIPICLVIDTNRLYILYTNGTGVDTWVDCSYVIADINRHRYSIAYSSNAMKIYVDGIPVKSITGISLSTDGTSTTGNLGKSIGSAYANGYIKNYRIGSLTPTDAKVLSDASLPILPVELDTTYYAPLQKDLSAVYAVPNLQEIISDITLLNDPINKDLPSDITLDRWTFNNDITCDLTLSSEPAYFYNGAEEYDGTITYDT